MKRSNWLIILPCVVSACLLTTWLLLPFRPRVTFGSPQIGFYSDVNGTGYPDVSVTLRNDSRFPIWFRGNESCIGEFSIDGNPQKVELKPHPNSDFRWHSIAFDEIATASLPVYDLPDNAKIAIKLRDWRGREAICSSREFDFSSVPSDGVAGIGLKPPVPIPGSN